MCTYVCVYVSIYTHTTNICLYTHNVYNEDINTYTFAKLAGDN